MSYPMKGVIHNGKVEVDEPIDLPEGTEVIVASATDGLDGDPVAPHEIARVLAAMRRLLPLDIPNDAADDLDAWEKELDRYGRDHAEAGIEDVFR